MIPKERLIRVNSIEYSMDVNGQYKLDYRGKLVFDQSQNQLVYFHQDGHNYNNLPLYICDGLNTIFTPKDFINQEWDLKDHIQELIQLKQSFTVSEIIRLKNEGLI